MKNNIKTNKNQEKNKKNKNTLTENLEKLEKLKQKKEFERFMKILKISDKKLKRVQECSSKINMISNAEKTKGMLSGGEFCNDRMCPRCSKRMMKKKAIEIIKLLAVAKQKYDYEFIFLTLTAPNVKAEMLDAEIKDFNKSFERMSKIKDFKACSNGYMRKLEITYNAERNDYHPHFHCIIAVNKSYFKSKNYISRKKWLEMWQSAKRDKTITQVDVRKIELLEFKNIYEIATYSAKHKDLYDNGAKVFEVFYKVFKGKKVFAYNGIFRDLKKLEKTNPEEFEDIEMFQELKETMVQKIFYEWREENKKYLEQKIIPFDANDIRQIYNFDTSDLEN